ncbi:MAG: hypothetical protein GY702_01465 [Desulfobulbaceae bacterium]|nr:hypothetical protein [Desulfobulbaceae bacterium]
MNMTQVLEIILGPVVWLMQSMLEFYVWLFSSLGFSILLLSLTLLLLLQPLRKKAEALEMPISTKMKATNTEVGKLKGNMKGEELFLATEKIYNLTLSPMPDTGYQPVLARFQVESGNHFYPASVQIYCAALILGP